MFSEEITNKLNEKLDKSQVSQRKKGNVMLDYIEGYYVIDQLNQVFGFGAWNMEVLELTHITSEVNAQQNQVVGYRARVKLVVFADDGSLVCREDVGFGSGIAKSLFDAHEGAGKEAVTDALKRACRTLGNIFGLALYDKTQKNVEDKALEHKKARVALYEQIVLKVGKSSAKECSEYLIKNGLNISEHPVEVLKNQMKAFEALVDDFIANNEIANQQTPEEENPF